MDLDTSVQQVVERLNNLNRYLLYFPEANPKQLEQDEIIVILDQTKANVPEWHEAMVNASIYTYEMPYEESVSNFKRSEESVSNFKRSERKSLALKPNLDSLWPSFSKKLIHLKGN
jgi:hypothetical protein